MSTHATQRNTHHATREAIRTVDARFGKPSAKIKQVAAVTCAAYFGWKYTENMCLQFISL